VKPHDILKVKNALVRSVHHVTECAICNLVLEFATGTVELTHASPLLENPIKRSLSNHSFAERNLFACLYESLNACSIAREHPTNVHNIHYHMAFVVPEY
jgi:hypothetical protein